MFCQLLRPAARRKHLGIWFRCLHFYLSKISVKRPQTLKSQSEHMMSECLLFLSWGISLASQSDLGVSNCSKGTAVWVWFAWRKKKKKKRHIFQRHGTISNFPLHSHLWIPMKTPDFKLFWRLNIKHHFPVSPRDWLSVSLNLLWRTRAIQNWPRHLDF